MNCKKWPQARLHLIESLISLVLRRGKFEVAVGTADGELVVVFCLSASTLANISQIHCNSVLCDEQKALGGDTTTDTLSIYDETGHLVVFELSFDTGA